MEETCETCGTCFFCFVRMGREFCRRNPPTFYVGIKTDPLTTQPFMTQNSSYSPVAKDLIACGEWKHREEMKQ